jgi:glutathione S-transferase
VPFFWACVRTPPEKRDHAAIVVALKKATRAWQILDEHLVKNRYLAGEAFSIGDIPLGIWAYRWFNLPVERPNFPLVRAWYDRLTERPAYQTHVMIPMT